jgi:hypothetical protein
MNSPKDSTQLIMPLPYASSMRDGLELNFKHLGATFKDISKALPHSWFPYLEGYSHRFVERVRHEYFQNAKRIN